MLEVADASLIGVQVGFNHALSARQHVYARRAAREDMLGNRYKMARIFHKHMLPDLNRPIGYFNNIIRVFTMLAAFAAPRCGGAALANDGALAQVGPDIERSADIRHMNMPAQQQLDATAIEQFDHLIGIFDHVAAFGAGWVDHMMVEHRYFACACWHMAETRFECGTLPAVDITAIDGEAVRGAAAHHR